LTIAHKELKSVKQEIDTKVPTEQKIREVARKHFYEKGLAGARMQEIADEVGINKAMLHYYFTSKEHLFRAVFLEALHEVLPVMVNALLEEAPFEEKLEKLVSAHIDLYLKNPFVPGFIVHEINLDPEMLFEIIFTRKGIEKGTVQAVLARVLDEEFARGCIRRTDPRQFIMDIYSLTAFPFIGRTLFANMFDTSEKAIEELMLTRKKHVTEVLLSYLRK